MRLRRRSQSTDHHTRRFYGWLVALAVLVAYAVAFIVQNDHSVSVCFVFATARVSLIWVILLSLAVGLLGGILLVQLERRRHRRPDKRAEPGDPV